MRRTTLGRFLATQLLIAVLAWGGSATVTAQGVELCPEPNDALQQACGANVGDGVTGYLSSPNDVDYFRFDSLDWDADIGIELLSGPFAYRITLFDWNGNPIGTSESAAPLSRLRGKLGPPGAYFFAVDSLTGEFSASVPYVLGARLDYPSGSAPAIIATAEFREPEAGLQDRKFNGADFATHGGYFEANLQQSGSMQSGAQLWRYWGPAVDDFSFTVDMRMLKGPTPPTPGGGVIGFHLATRPNPRTSADGIVSLDDMGVYLLQCDLSLGRLRLRKVVYGPNADVTDFVRVPTIARDGVTRVNVRMVGQEIVVAVNGGEVMRLRDGSLKAGQFALGAVSWGEPATVRYDNVLVTTPAAR
jgi:hypothetical protein